MAYHVQAEVRNGNTIYIGWYECSEILNSKFEEGFTLADVWPGSILMDTKGVDSKDLRSITDDDIARGFRAKLLPLKQ